MAYLLDTNILLRTIDLKHPLNEDTTKAIERLRSANHLLYIVPQNLIEAWNVCTRPLDKNGLGMSIDQTDTEIKRLERLFILLPDSPAIYPQWRTLVKQYNVQGVNVHDTRIVAAMLVHRISHILTFNIEDFKRFTEITVVHPNDILS